MSTPMERALEQVEWIATEAIDENSAEGLPMATHSGVLKIGGFDLRCYRLNDGRAIFDAEDVQRFFGWAA